MGHTGKKLYTDREHINRFVYALIHDIKALELMLNDGMVESGVQRIGAEQELCLLDASWRPAPWNLEVLEKLGEPHFTTEHSRYNLEINLDPLEFGGDCLSQMAAMLNQRLSRVEEVAGDMGGHIILTGLLPTIRRSDLELDNLTPLPRYQILNDTLNRLKGGPYEFRIEGKDELITKHNSIMFEGCNTSFQVHLQVSPVHFTEAYNWAQAIAGPVLSAAANSPLLLGKRLWQETRIALFQQSVDIRKISDTLREHHPRVTFGTHWAQSSIAEIFTDDFARHRPLLGIDIGKDSLEQLKAGKIPKLKAFALHNGTIYKWNRPCYGITNGRPHLRIESRMLPAGPTVADQVANAAFWLGLMNMQPDAYRDISRLLDFDDAKRNFFKAARHGLETQFRWMNNRLVPAPALILDELLPVAEEGLQKAKVLPDDIRFYLGIIEARVLSGQTGSQWLLESFEKLRPGRANYEVCVALAAATVARQKEGRPVHQWELASAEEAGSWANRYWKAGQIMDTGFLAVHEEDLVYFVANLMHWKGLRYLPVENEEGQLTGLLTSRRLLDFYANPQKYGHQDATVRSIMIREPVTAHPEMPSLEALRMMRSKKIGCLPVVDKGCLVGLLTELSFMNLSEEAIRLLGESGKDGNSQQPI